MVDFDNEATVGVPAGEILKILILQRRTYVFDSYELLVKQDSQGVVANVSLFKSRLHALFLEIQSILKRRMKKDEYTALTEDLDSNEISVLYRVMISINDQLDDLNLTRIDTRKRYDSTKVEYENGEKGL